MKPTELIEIQNKVNLKIKFESCVNRELGATKLLKLLNARALYYVNCDRCGGNMLKCHPERSMLMALVTISHHKGWHFGVLPLLPVTIYYLTQKDIIIRTIYIYIIYICISFLGMITWFQILDPFLTSKGKKQQQSTSRNYFWAIA